MAGGSAPSTSTGVMTVVTNLRRDLQCRDGQRLGHGHGIAWSATIATFFPWFDPRQDAHDLPRAADGCQQFA